MGQDKSIFMTDDVAEYMAERARNLRRPLLHYNNFFHPNLCHVCKSEEQNKLRPCMKCKMIFYCSEDHRLFDQVEHKDICQAVENVIKQRNIWDSRKMDSKEWINFRNSNVNALKSILQRKLKKNEMELFLNVKSCFICREQQNLVYICLVCKSINLCSDHKDFIRESHNCEMRRHSLEINIFAARNGEHQRIPTQLLYLKPNIENMKSFIEESFGYSDSINRWPLRFYIYSDNFSKPLTLLYGIKVANLLPLLPMHGTFVIHLIDGSLVRYKLSLAWEIMLHELSHITNLIIIMTEPLLRDNAINIQLCEICTRSKKSLQYIFISKDYHEYTQSKTYKRANLIIVYETELQKNLITILNLEAMQRERCPVLLTTSSVQVTQNNIINIQEILGSHLTPIFNNRNKFLSHRPIRDYVNDNVFLPYQYLIVYQSLYLTKRK